MQSTYIAKRTAVSDFVCPICEHSGDNVFRIDYPGRVGVTGLRQKMDCLRCGAVWFEHYELSGYSLIHSGTVT